jgi:hypothetical protein
MNLKACVMLGKDDARIPYLYHLNAADAAPAHH